MHCSALPASARIVLQYVDDGDDQPLTLCKSTENIKYGLWCGNKFPRVRSVDYSYAPAPWCCGVRAVLKGLFEHGSGGGHASGP